MKHNSKMDSRRRKGHYVLALLAALLAVALSEGHGPSHSQSNASGNARLALMLSKQEVAEKIKELLEDQPERPDGPDFVEDFETLFGELEAIANGMPDDFNFDFDNHGPTTNHPRHAMIKDNRCMRNPRQFKNFLHRILQVIHDLRTEYHDDLHDSTDMDRNYESAESTDSPIDVDDSSTNSTESQEMDDNTTETPDFTEDDPNDGPNTSANTDTETERKKRNTGLEGFDLDEVLDRLEESDVECFINFVSRGDKRFLCQRFAHRSSGIFSKLIASGAECEDFLLEDDDHSTSHDHDDDDDDDDVSDVRKVSSDKDIDVNDESVDAEMKDGGDDIGDEIEDIIDDILDSSNDNSDTDAVRDDDDSELGDLKKNDDSDEIDDFDGINDGYGDDDDSEEDESEDRDRSQKRHRLDESHQMAIINRLKQRPSQEWNEDDVRKVMTLAPDVIDDDFIDDLSEKLFKMNSHHLGRLAYRRAGNPRLRYALRQRFQSMSRGSISADDISRIGPGLLTLRLDQIDELDGDLLLGADLDNLFDDDDDDDRPPGTLPRYDDDDDDDDDDDEDGIRLALGRKMKQAGIRPSQIGKAMRFLHDDLDFVRSVEPDDLLEHLSELRKMDYGDDDARAVLMRLSQSGRFPSPSQMTGQNLTGLGHLMRGMGVTELSKLRRDALEEALDKIKYIDFDESQAEEIVDDLLDDDEVENFSVNDVRRLGRLTRGLTTDKIMMIRDEAIEDMLDELDDLDLNDAQKRIIAQKARAGYGDKVHPKFLELDDFAEVVSVDELEEFDDDMIKNHIAQSAKVHWRLPQAAQLARKYRQANGARRLRPSDLAAMGRVASGLLPKDLDDMGDTLDDVMDMAEELKDIHEDLTSGQIDEMVELFNDVGDLDNKDVVIGEAEALQGSYLMAYLPQNHFEKLEFTEEGMKAFVSQVAKMSTRKMSRAHVTFLARKMLDMIEDFESASSTGDDDESSRRLRSLGQMALGLTPAQIQAFDSNAVIDNLDILRTLPLSKAQALAVLMKVQEGHEDWNCRSDLLARLGPLLQYQEGPFGEDCDSEILGSFSAVMKGLEKHSERVQERLDEGFDRENPDLMEDNGVKRVVDAMVAATIPQMNVRRRRAVAEGAFTCDIARRLKNSVNQVDIQLISTMKNTEFQNCLATLGSVSDWSNEAVAALASKAKSVYKDISSWSNEIIRRAGSIIAGLSLAEIQQLQLTGVDAMNSIARHGKLSAEQLRAGFLRWMHLTGKANDVTKISDGEFSSLSDFVCGLDMGHVNNLPDTTFRRSIAVIGHSKSCPEEILQAYANKALSVYGNDITTWSPAVVGDMGHLLGALPDDHVHKLTTEQLALVTPVVVKSLPPNKVAAMTRSQLSALSTNQANAITQEQYEALNSAQQGVVEKRASVEFSKTSETGPGTTYPGGGDNGTPRQVISFICLVPVMMAIFLM